MRLKSVQILILIALTEIALSQSSPVDTICLNLKQARRLAFYKTNYIKIDSIKVWQTRLITAQKIELARQTELIADLRLQIQAMSQKIDLEKKYGNLKLKQEKGKHTFFKEAKKYLIGGLFGYLIAKTISGKPP